MIFQRTATTPFNSVSQPKGAVHFFPWPFAQFYLQPSLPWVNWRCLRTSHAVWLKLAGADVKDAQGQMRHSRASTTLDKPGPPNHLKKGTPYFHCEADTYAGIGLQQLPDDLEPLQFLCLIIFLIQRLRRIPQSLLAKTRP